MFRIASERMLSLLVLLLVIEFVNSEHSYSNASKLNAFKTWSLADYSNPIGTIFEYQLPMSLFGYQVIEVDSNSLPNWLFYDENNFKLKGFPTDAALTGKSTYIQVTPLDSDLSPDEAAIEVFKINHEKYNVFSKEPLDGEVIKCKPFSPLTTTTVILNAQLIQMDLNDRFKLADNFIKFFELSPKAIRILELGDTPIYDSQALVAGPGDVKIGDGVSGEGFVVQWEVGCGAVQSKHLATLQNVETSASNGELKDALGYSVIGWYVTNKKSSESKRPKHRFKRYYAPTPTPTIELTSSTITSTTAKTTTIKMTKPKPSKKTKPTGKPSKLSPTPISSTVLTTVNPLFPLIGSSEIKATRTELNLPKIYVGEVFEYRLPTDLFIDSERNSPEGITSKLILTNGMDAPVSSWLKLEMGSQLRGVPLLEHEGVQEYIIKGMNEAGKLATCSLKMEVGQMSKKGRVAELGAKLDLDFKSFMKNATMRILITESIASAFGDPDPSQIIMTHVKEGSIDYSWTNRSIVASSTGECPTDQLTKLFDNYISEEGVMNDGFVNTIKPMRIEGGSATAYGVCAQHVRSRQATRIAGKMIAPNIRTTIESVHIVVPLDGESKAGETKSKTSDGMLVRIVIPVLIIIAIVILALIIACVLYRKRKAKKKKVPTATLR